MGIGAYSYDRRVVENQRHHLFQEIAKVARRLGLPDAVSDLYVAASKEDQFSKGVRMVGDALPASLMIEGRNPLLLLHAALSDGLHGRSDDECLEIAGDIRNVLGRLAERIDDALADHEELKASVQRLADRINK